MSYADVLYELITFNINKLIIEYVMMKSNNGKRMNSWHTSMYALAVSQYYEEF